VNVAYDFTSPRAASYQLAQMIILPRLEARTHALDVGPRC